VDGGTATYLVTVKAINGYSGQVIMSSSGLLGTTTVTFSPANVTPTAAGATTTMTVKPVNIDSGQYNITITGQSGTLSTHFQDTNVVMTVSPGT